MAGTAPFWCNLTALKNPANHSTAANRALSGRGIAEKNWKPGPEKVILSSMNAITANDGWIKISPYNH